MKTVAQKHVEEKIMTIRDVQVMLDKDLAAFYEVAPIRLRNQVRRNTNRFPADFVFQLTELEVEQLRYLPKKAWVVHFLMFLQSKVWQQYPEF